MPIEIERKYLVAGQSWRNTASAGRRFCQGYLAKTQRGSMRVRRVGDSAMITVKGRRHGIARLEYEYPIPVVEAEEMLRSLCIKPLIEKIRYEVEHRGMMWEVDVYCGEANGLIMAEIELETSRQLFELPQWLGAEVTHDLRYRTDAIAQGQWRKTDDDDDRRRTRENSEIRETRR